MLYADDMVLIAETEEQLLKLLDVMYVWCKKWRLKINKGKTKVVHFRPQKRKRSEYEFDYDFMYSFCVRSFGYNFSCPVFEATQSQLMI